QTEDRPGGAGNVALNMAALGCGVSLIGVVGDDEAGHILHSRLKAAKIHTNFQISATKPTVTKLRVVSRHQQLLRMDFEERFDASDSCEFTSKVKALINRTDALVLSDYAKGSLVDCQSLIRMAR